MKTIFLFIALLATNSFAAVSYKIEDAALLGQYKLKQADKKLQYKSATLYWDDYATLTLSLGNGDQEFTLDAPDKNGVMRDGAEEFDCEDSSCGGISYVKVTLQDVKNSKGKSVPGLFVEITETWATNEDDGSGDTVYEDTNYEYAFVWDNNSEGFKVSPVRTMEVATDLAQMNTSCNAVVKAAPLSIYDLHVCGFTSAFVYDGELSQVWPRILEIVSSESSAKLVNVSQIAKNFFAPLREKVIAYAKERNKTESEIADLLNQFNEAQAFFKMRVSDGAKLYMVNRNRYSYFFIVDENTKTVNILKYFDME